MEQLSQHTVTSYEKEKEQELKPTIIETLLYVTSATWDLIKAKQCLKQKEWNSGKMHIEEQLEHYLNTDF